VLRFKHFRSGAESLETSINEWLDQSQPDVKFMGQSTNANGDVVISFLYEEGFMATEQRLTEEASAIVEQALADRSGEPLFAPVLVEENTIP